MRKKRYDLLIGIVIAAYLALLFLSVYLGYWFEEYDEEAM